MSINIPLEIERKYLIDRPDEALLRAQAGCQVVRIEQVYLRSDEKGVSARVRRWEEDGKTTFFLTEKRAISALTRVEEEREISEETYRSLLCDKADSTCAVISKTRYRIPYCGQCVEVDVFPFWERQAIAEVELENEQQPVFLPPYLTVRREVTADRRYTNRAMARAVPEED